MVSPSRRRFLNAFAATSAVSLFPDLIRSALAVPANNTTGTLADVEHVVIFMQENRAFDHYFGTLSGVRGFGDPRAIELPGGKPVWYQPDGAGGYVLPFHFDAKNTSALSVGTNHSWKGSQATWQAWDAWVRQKTAQSMGYFDRGDIPFYYALADAFTICDDYHCSIFGATDPNRMYSLTGTNQGWQGSMGSLYNISPTGYYNNDPAKDNISPSVTASAPNWRTYAETLEANQVTWKVYQEWDNYGDNYLAYFRNFRVNADGTRLSTSSPLYQRGRQLAPGSTEANSAGTKGDWLVASFADDVRNDRLPQVSWICAPNDYTEHAPNSPNAGENLTARLLAALVANPAVWSKTVFLLTYDENDGFFDHVPPHQAPITGALGKATLASLGAYETYQSEPVGLGPRVPMLVISPWTKGGRVCSQLFDHTSKLRFLEEWLVAKGKARAGVACEQISPWRRAICGDLTSAFNFTDPDAAWPSSVPATASYVKVSGKPYPTPPAVQTLPRQELCTDASNTREACALPYELAVHGRAAPGGVALTFNNTGMAGAAFIVYSSVRTDGPWYYTVEAGKSIAGEMWNFTGAAYDLRVHGANGFLRHFKGATAATGARPEISATHDGVHGALQLALSNAGTAATTLTVTDNAYGASATRHTLAAGQTLALDLPLGASYGWYDLSITCDTDAQWSRKVAGHVESGQASRTDPMIGVVRTPAAALEGTARYVTKGAPATFTYAAPAGKLDAKNWVGIFSDGTAPGNGSSGSSLLWAYAPNATGSVSFATASLAVGDYNAWYLYQNGYAVLGGPVPFSVSQLTPSATSVAHGTSLVFDYAVPASKVTSKNWIGIWKAGVAPASGTWLSWQYVTKASGKATFDTSKLAAGNYAAWLFHNDSYTVLAGPVGFTVT
jgi:phospholipase C